MKSNRKNRLILVAGVVALGLSAFNATNAQAYPTQTTELVESIGLTFPGMAAVLTVKNTSANKHVNAVNLDVQENELNFDISGSVRCKDGYAVTFRGASAFFGAVGVTGSGKLSSTSTLHSADIDVAYSEDGGIAEYTEDTFTVPVNKVENGHPVLRVNALEEINKKLQLHLQNGGNAVDFYKQDHDFLLKRPIALVGVCGNHGGNEFGFISKDHTIQIKYEGDPAINDKPVLNAQLQGGMPNQVNNDFPFKMDKAEFMPNIPHSFGKCLPESNPIIRINLQFSGSTAGLMDLRVLAVSNTYAAYGSYYEFSAIPVNPMATNHIDFPFPLKQMLSQNKYSYMAVSNNKTYNHNMKIEARYKPKEGGEWSVWKDYDTGVFKHRCTPQLNSQLQGGNNGGIGGYSNGGATLPAKAKSIKAAPLGPKPLGKAAPRPTPTPKPLGKAALRPMPTPKPLGKAAPRPTPTPKPLGIALPKPSPEPGLILKSAKPTR